MISDRINLIEKQIETLGVKIKNSMITKKELESEFLSIKMKLKNFKLPFFLFFLKKKIQNLNEKREIISRIKNLIDLSMKNGKTFEHALLLASESNELKKIIKE